MVAINFAKREINIKVVLYGPGFAGKATLLEWISKKYGAELTSVPTEGDRTIFLEFLPPYLRTIGGMDTKVQLYAVVGACYYNATRKLVLQGADAVVFVADSQATKLEENQEYITNLEENLRAQGLDPETIPTVLLWNKRDLEQVTPVEDLEEALNKYGSPTFEGITKDEEHPGGYEAVAKAIKIATEKLNAEYGLKAADRAQRSSAKPKPKPKRPPVAASSPPPSPAPPSLGRSPQPTATAAASPSFDRRATVRYFEQMYPQRNYPLVVAFSQSVLRQVALAEVKQVGSDQRITLTKESPWVTIQPILPGCLVTPSQARVDLTPALTSVTFWVTPLALGRVEDASIEVRQGDALACRVSIPIRVVTQTLAKVSAVASALSPLIKPALASSGLNLQTGAAQVAWTVVGWITAHGAWPMIGFFAALAGGFYVRSRPRRGTPREAFFEIEQVKDSSWHPEVEREQARLLIVASGSPPRVHPLDRPYTSLGSASDATLRLSGLDPRHATIAWNPDGGFTLDPRGSVWRELKELDAPLPLGRGTVLTFVRGALQVWFYDERPDPRADALRDRLLETLLELAPQTEVSLRDAFATGVHKPVRKLVADLLTAGTVEPEQWFRARTRLGLDSAGPPPAALAEDRSEPKPIELATSLKDRCPHEGSPPHGTRRKVKIGTPRDDRSLVGQVIGDYRIESVAGEGLLGWVYRATHVSRGQTVAFRALEGCLANSPDTRSSFLHEFTALIQFNHPHLVPAVNLTQRHDEHFVVSPWVAGEALSSRLAKDGPIDAKTLASWFSSYCRGLAFAHERGLYHRDLRPRNLLVDRDGVPRILNFGLTALFMPEWLAPRRIKRGYLIYLSREQALDDPLDARSDIGSLGACLYECATGKPPFSSSEGDEDLMVQILTRPPSPPSKHVSDLPPDLEAIILRAMAKDPDDRFQTASEMEDALARLT